MKTPEYLLSTPRLIAVVLTLALVYLTIEKVVEPKEFMGALFLVFGYFFGSRGKEDDDGKTSKEASYDIIEKASVEQIDPDMEILSSKYDSHDTSTQY